jgi:hypothetical protein
MTGSSPAMTVENRRHASEKAKIHEVEIGRLRVVSDFLPPPDQFVPREENVKVTHQRMIGALVDEYAVSQPGSRALKMRQAR